MALAVPLSRFTSRVGGGSAFFVRPRSHATLIYRPTIQQKRLAAIVLIDSRADYLVCPVISVVTNLIERRRRESTIRSWSRLYYVCVIGFPFCLFQDRRAAGRGFLVPLFGFIVGAVFSELLVFDDSPNKSPEPTAVGAVSSAIAVHVVSRRWLSFFR